MYSASKVLKNRRGYLNLTQPQMASFLGITTKVKMSASKYQKIEQGTLMIPAMDALAISTALKLDFKDIWCKH